MKSRFYDDMTDEAKRRWEGQKSEPLSFSDRSIVQLLAREGFHQKRIAALFDCNQGRIDDALKVGA
jgi:DNA-directed RNA polymerase specialized sigma24 family protein